MTPEEYDKKVEALKEASICIKIINTCKNLDNYKNHKHLSITMECGDEKDFYSWKLWTLTDYDEDLLLDVMSAIKKYQARLTKKLEEIE